MNTLSILAMAMVIYLFGGYLDKPEVRLTKTEKDSYDEQAGINR